METWDFIIIGGGAAGLSAGIYAARSGLKTLVIEEKISGGTTADAPTVENYPGFSQINGAELAEKISTQCKKAGAIINEIEAVLGLNLLSEIKSVKTTQTLYESKAILIATGSRYRELGIPGEKEFRGRGVSYCGVCDGPLFKGKRVLVVGGGNTAAITALYLSGIASIVVLVHRRHAFRCEETLLRDVQSKPNVQIMWNAEIKEIKGEKLVKTAVILDGKTGSTQEVAVDAVFVQIGESPNSQIARDSGVEVNDEGYIKIDVFQRTNVPGVYAAGDVTNHPVKQIGTAVGQGITAALEAYSFVRRPYYRKDR